MGMRQGIKRARQEGEARRRAEAKQLGVVLERPAKEKDVRKAGHRERGVGAPSVGKFKGGTLKLSSKDISNIRGSGGGGGRGRGKGGRR